MVDEYLEELNKLIETAMLDLHWAEGEVEKASQALRRLLEEKKEYEESQVKA